jgi:hypothetical protein
MIAIIANNIFNKTPLTCSEEDYKSWYTKYFSDISTGIEKFITECNKVVNSKALYIRKETPNCKCLRAKNDANGIYFLICNNQGPFEGYRLTNDMKFNRHVYLNTNKINQTLKTRDITYMKDEKSQNKVDEKSQNKVREYTLSKDETLGDMISKICDELHKESLEMRKEHKKFMEELDIKIEKERAERESQNK